MWVALRAVAGLLLWLGLGVAMLLTVGLLIYAAARLAGLGAARSWWEQERRSRRPEGDDEDEGQV